MARNLKEIEQEVMHLSSKDRVSLMERLIEALDTETEGDVEGVGIKVSGTFSLLVSQVVGLGRFVFYCAHG